MSNQLTPLLPETFFTGRVLLGLHVTLPTVIPVLSGITAREDGFDITGLPMFLCYGNPHCKKFSVDYKASSLNFCVSAFLSVLFFVTQDALCFVSVLFLCVHIVML
jgi:hypothetical protein